MASFEYTARTKEGSVQHGTMSASDRATVLSTLRQRNLIPVIIKQAATKKGVIKISIPFIGGKVKAKDVVVLTRQLSTMINAGVPIVRALHTLSDQTESSKLKVILTKVIAEVEGGAPLSDSLEKYPKVFSPVYVNMVRAGETGGILDQILERLANQVEKDADIKSKLRGAMIYPSILMCITFGAFIFLMTGIIPKLKEIFDEYDAQLPIHTRVMLSISEAMQKYGVLLAIIAIVLVILLVRFIKTPKGKKAFDRLILKMPIVGPVVLKVNVARFSRTFSSLTGAGVSVLDGLNVTAQALNNSILREAIEKAAEKVKNGAPISASLEETKIFPPIVPQMTAVGEETGQVDKVLGKVADFYEKEVDRVIANMTSIIEPLMIIVLGGLVGLIVASVFGPISELTNVVK